MGKRRETQNSQHVLVKPWGAFCLLGMVPADNSALKPSAVRSYMAVRLGVFLLALLMSQVSSELSRLQCVTVTEVPEAFTDAFVQEQVCVIFFSS